MAAEAKRSGFLHWLRIISIGRRPKWTLVRVAVLVVVTFVTFKFVLLPVRVKGLSMEPTYHNHSINFINRLSYSHSAPRHGDVVALREFPGQHFLLLKRVVGLPGETVSFSGGHVWLDGVRQDEPYLRYATNWEIPAIKLGPDEYYIVGDNRSMPWQDHVQGAAQRRQIIGKPVLPGTWWPAWL